VHINLPVISLPTFDGKICNWLQYRDTFEALNVNNTTLSIVQKYHYFIASLNNVAKDLVANLQIMNENFLVAWQLVTKRYNNKRLIAMMHAKHLCQMPLAKQGDATSLRQLIDHVSSHMNAIQALSLNVPVQDLMLIHLMLATVDNDTQQHWELNTATSAEIPTTAELITFLEARCRALELIQNTQSTSVVTTNPQPTPSTKTATTKPQGQQPAGNKVSKPVQCYVATQTMCTLCNGSHRLFKCGKFHHLQSRQCHNHVKQQGLCFNCLQPFVKGHTCSQQQCCICHKRHHTPLHITKQPQTANANRTTTNNRSPAATRDQTSAEGTTYHTFKGRPRNHVILATAVVEVRDKTGQYVPCRALLDSGSQTHFITEKCVQRPKLSRIQTHTSIQGISNMNTAIQHSVSLHLRSRHTDWNTTLECAVLNNIAGTTPLTRLDTSSWKIPTDINLADKYFNQPGGIDLLIGADQFYEMLQSGR
jgi:hypothetical protein